MTDGVLKSNRANSGNYLPGCCWSGKRGSNPRPSAWEELSCYAFTPLRGVKQPTELLPLISDIIRITAI